MDTQQAEKHVIYKVFTKYNKENNISDEMEVYHRYNDFSEFNNKLVSLHKSNKLRSQLPIFPQSSLISLFKDVEGDRVNKLNQYLLSLVNTKEFMENRDVLNIIKQFVMEGEVNYFIFLFFILFYFSIFIFLLF